MGSLEMVRRALAGKPVHEIEAFLRQHLTYAEACAVLRQVEAATPKIDVHRERDMRLAETGDPEKYMAEIFGYWIYDDTRRLIYAIEEHPWVLGIGGHATGKTFIGGANVLGWHWGARGSELNNEGTHQGCLLVLTAPKARKILDTSYRDYRRHADRAVKHSGHVIAGSQSASPASVNWRAHPETWLMVSETPQNPSTSAADQVSHAGAGHHHPNLVVHAEEAMAVAPSMWTTIEGWGPRKVVAFLNPTYAGGAIYSQVLSGAWHVVDLSALRNPNVLERRVVIPGCVSHRDIERRLRRPGHARKMGLLGGVTPDPKFKDFCYALPTQDLEEAEGPRDDGHPGHPLAQVMVWRPSPQCCGMDLGVFPPASTSGIFDPGEWASAVQRWQACILPTCVPDVVGVDSADDGPDPIATVPRWGRSARQLFKRFLDVSQRTDDHDEVIRYTSTCPRCEGVNHENCLLCDEGQFQTILGEPRNAPKDDGDRVAEFLLSSWGVERLRGKIVRPLFVLDKACGMRIGEALRRRGAPYRYVSFGGKPDRALPGQQPALNKRASMYGNFGDAVNFGLVDLPPANELKQDCLITEREIIYRSSGGASEPLWKIQEKTKIAAELRRSPDDGDAAALSLCDTTGKLRGIS